MTETAKVFQYGDPCPLPDLDVVKLVSRIKVAELYLKLLAKANDQILEGKNGLLSGLAYFDKELANIHACWQWAAENISETWGAVICRYLTVACSRIAELHSLPACGSNG